MWIGTGEGLVCFLSTNELNYKTYQRKDGLINTNICAITEDKKGISGLAIIKVSVAMLRIKTVFITMATLTMFRQEASQVVV